MPSLISDTVIHLTLFRQIIKTANVLKIVNASSTGDAITYNIQFLGFNVNHLTTLHYLVVDETGTSKEITIEISPLIPLVELIDKSGFRTKYY